MNTTRSTKEKTKYFFSLFLPIFITQVALFSMNFFDTIMSGHASSADLAGVAIGISIWVPVSTGLTGILLAVTPTVAQLRGANKQKDIAHFVIQSIYFSIGTSILIIMLGYLIVPTILTAMNLDPHVRNVAGDFLFMLSFGIIPLFVNTVLRSFIDALGHTRTTMFITLFSLPVNVILNYLLIFGKFGLPKFGGVGSGIASAITYWFILLLMVYIIHTKQTFARFEIFHRLYRISFDVWKTLLKLGVPIGFAIFFETSIFAAVTLLMSGFDTTTIAAHQSAMNFATMLYMMPLSISMAMTIAVGFEVGAGRYRNAKAYSWLGICFAIGCAFLFSLFIYLFDNPIAAMYSNDAAVQSLTRQFLIYAILFQISDAIATPAQGALRGYKDVNTALLMTLTAYWIIGLPLGYVLAGTTWAAKGYWIGLISGLAIGATFLILRLVYVQKKREKALSS